MSETLATSSPLVDETLCEELRGACADARLWRALVGRFEAEARALLVEAGATRDARDPERSALALHRLRGAAASIAAPRLEHAIAELERDPAQGPRWQRAREVLDATVAALAARP